MERQLWISTKHRSVRWIIRWWEKLFSVRSAGSAGDHESGWIIPAGSLSRILSSYGCACCTWRQIRSLVTCFAIRTGTYRWNCNDVAEITGEMKTMRRDVLKCASLPEVNISIFSSEVIKSNKMLLMWITGNSQVLILVVQLELVTSEFMVAMTLAAWWVVVSELEEDDISFPFAHFPNTSVMTVLHKAVNWFSVVIFVRACRSHGPSCCRTPTSLSRSRRKTHRLCSTYSTITTTTTIPRRKTTRSTWLPSHRLPSVSEREKLSCHKRSRWDSRLSKKAELQSKRTPSAAVIGVQAPLQARPLNLGQGPFLQARPPPPWHDLITCFWRAGKAHKFLCPREWKQHLLVVLVLVARIPLILTAWQQLATDDYILPLPTSLHCQRQEVITCMIVTRGLFAKTAHICVRTCFFPFVWCLVSILHDNIALLALKLPLQETLNHEGVFSTAVWKKKLFWSQFDSLGLFRFHLQNALFQFKRMRSDTPSNSLPVLSRVTSCYFQHQYGLDIFRCQQRKTTIGGQVRNRCCDHTFCEYDFLLPSVFRSKMKEKKTAQKGNKNLDGLVYGPSATKWELP